MDVAYEYLTFFLEDDEELATIGRDYSSGALTTGEVKARLISVITEMVTEHQARRSAVSSEIVEQYMSVRPLEF